MSDKVVDERIVEMSFDNAKFEKGISRSQKSLKEFNKALNFDGATGAVNSFSASFTKMGAITFSILQNLTNRIVNFGVKAIKSFTLAPLTEGMGDYNTKLTTMQTITNATGKSIAQVEEYFGQLDEYADKTIYNLTDMTSALAKFTNANVALEKSVPAIKGIANMTALAGQDANAAAVAMYNLSQSIAGGFLTTRDYMSLNLANVATFEWKNQMIEAAVAAGTLKKSTNGYITSTGKAFSSAQLFTEGLSQQWATTDVLLKVLGDYGDETTAIGKKAQAAAQDVKSFGMMIETLRAAIGTGWTRTFELIFGDLAESKLLWTSITNAASAFLDTIANGRNIMLEFWKDNGGRAAFINGLRNVAIALVTVLLTISKAADQIFPPKTQEQFVKMFKTFENITSKLIISEKTADKLRRTFAGFFSVIGIGVEALKFLGGILGQIVKVFFPGFGGGVLEITANIGDFLVVLHDVIVNGNVFGNMLGYTGPAIEKFATFLKNAFYAVVGFIGGLIDGSITLEQVGQSIGRFVGTIKDFIGLLFQGQSVSVAFANTFVNVGKTFEDGSTEVDGFTSAFGNAFEGVKNFASFTASKVLPVLAWLGDKISNITMKEVGIVAIGAGLIILSKTLLRFFSPISSVLEGFSSVLRSVSGAIKSFSMNIKANALFTISKAIALLVISLIALTLVPVGKLAIGLGALTILMGELVVALLLLNKIKDPAKIGVQLVALSAGLFIIAKAAARFSDMSWEELAKAGVGIAGFLAILLGFIKLIGKRDIGKFDVGLRKFSAGLIALGAALFILGKIPFDALKQGIGVIAALLTMLVVYSKLINGLDLAVASSGMVKFGIGLIAMSGALAILGNLKFGTLLQGSVALLAMLATLGLYVKIVNKKDFTKASGGLIGFGLGLIAMTGALSILGKMPFDVLAKGSIGLLALLTTLALFVTLTNGKDLAVTGGSLIGLGVGLLAMSGALAVLGSIDTNKLIQGGIAIIALMAAIAIFVKLTDGGDLGVSAGGMIAFALGIGILSGVLALLTLLDTTSLIAAAGAISILIAAIALFSSITNIGSLLGSALGIVAFAVALTALAIPISIISNIPWQHLAATAGIIVIAVGMFALVSALMPVFAAVAPLIGPALVGVLGVAAVIAEIGLLIAIFGGLAKIPGAMEFINGGGDILLAIGTAIGNFVGGIIGGIGEGITAALPAIADNLTKFAIGIQPFFEAIKSVDSEGVQSVKYLAETLLLLGGAAVLDALTSWFTGGSSLTTFAAELKAFAPDFVAFAKIIADGNVNNDVINATANAVKTISKVAKGLPNQGGKVAEWLIGDNTLSVFAAELKSFAPDFVFFAKTIADGNINEGLVDTTASAVKTMSEVAKGLPNQGGKVAEWLIGDNTLSVFAAELKSFAPDFVFFANTIKDAKIDKGLVDTTASAVQTMSKVATGLPNQGGTVVKWFVGDNTLSVFAAELKSFAPDFVSFANNIKEAKIDDGLVTTTANAVRAMSEVAEGLPNQGGTVLKWFVGDNTLSTFADELVKFAPKFVSFADTFGNVKTTTIMPGIEALNILINTMQISGKETMNNLAKGFEKNKESTIKKIKEVLEGVVISIAKYTDDMVTSGENIVKGLIEGMKDKQSDIRKAVKEIIVDTVNDTIHTEFDMHSPSEKTIEDGKNIVQGLINGVKDKKDDLIDTIKSVAKGAGDSANTSSLTSGLEGLLGNLTNGFGLGGMDAGDSFGNALTNSSYTDALNGLGDNSKGTLSNVKSAFEKFKAWLDEEKFYLRIDTAGEIVEWEKQQLLYKKGTEERKEIDRNLYTLANQLINERYQNEMDAIEKKNYYGKLSLEAELARYREMKKTYEIGSEERMAINRKIFELEKKIYETQKQYIEDIQTAQTKAADDRLKAQQDYDNSVSEAQKDAAKDRAEANEGYNEAIANAEKDAAKKRTDAYDKYNEAMQKASENNAKDRVKLEEDLAKDIEDIQSKLLSDLDAAERKYADAVKSRADTIYTFYNLFDSVSEREITTPEELLKNLSDQNAAIEDWRYSLQQLETRGVSDTLIDELQQLGVSSSGQLSAMLAMTDEQLSEFVAMFDRKHEIANSQAIKELVDYRSEINDEIAALYAQADIDTATRVETYNSALDEMNAALRGELDEAQNTLTESLTEINTTLNEKTTEAKDTLNERLTEINNNLQDKLSTAETTFSTTMTQINKELDEQLKTLKTNFETSMETVHDKTTKEYKDLNKDLKKELETMNTEADTQLSTLSTTSETKTDEAATAMTDNIAEGSTEAQEILSDLNTSVDTIFSGFEQSLYDVGLNGSIGLSNGLRAGEYMVRIAGQSLGDAALNAAKRALDTNSPSREMEKIGLYADLGFVNGLVKYTAKVEDAGASVGQSALDALTDTMSRLAYLCLDEFDLNPVITPVLDLNAFRRNAGMLRDMLSTNNSYDIGNASLAHTRDALILQNGSDTNTTTNIYNTFKLEGLSVRSDADIDLIADKLHHKQNAAGRGRGLRANISSGRR